MTIKTSSDNLATLTILRSGNRVVVDADWQRAPSRRDMKELNRLLRVGDKALNLSVQDDNRRAEVAREFLAGGDESRGVQ